MISCQNCNGACCRVLDYYIGDSRTLIEFFKARGFKIIDGYAMIESVCPLLELNKCSIHETKPVLCKLMPVGGEACLRARKFYGLED